MQTKKELQQLNKQEEGQDDSNINPFQENIPQQQQQQSPKRKKSLQKSKKSKKHKKSKRQRKLSKKKRKMAKQSENEEPQEDQDNEINSMFEDEAESGDDDEDGDEEAEVGFQEERQRFQQLYKRPNATERLMERFKGKNEKQINAQYSKKAIAFRKEEEYLPSDKDPKIFVVHVKPGSEDLLVIKILNKAKYFYNKPGQLSIVSAMSLKKKFPGRIFVEAFSDSDVYESLSGLNDIYFGKKILPLELQLYECLFTKQVVQKIEFTQNSYVRVKKGLYQGDLAKVFKVKKNSVDVMLVPRINVMDVKIKILRETDHIADEKAKELKKQELLKLLINHKQKNYKQRPPRRQLFEEDFDELKEIPGVKSIRLGSINGLIIVNYTPEQLEKVSGTYLPVEIMPFTTQGKLVEELKQDYQNLVTAVNFKKGEDVQIIAGDLEKHYGTLVEIKGNVGIIRCKNKDLRGQILEQPLDCIAKRFKQGQRVKVISGSDIGKTGLIISVQAKTVQIWTQNSNSLRISKKNLEICSGQTICTSNVHQLKKDDLIKTNKNIVGVVLQTTKDNIKLLTTQNIVQIVSNMDFDQKITIKHLVAKNKLGEEIKQGAIVFVLSGLHQGKRCRVVHVYRQFVFLFNQEFRRSGGVVVENADNCSLLSKNDTGRTHLTTKNFSSSKNSQFQQEQDEIKLGDTITLKSGPLKGYKGVVKSIRKDKIQVRVLSKAYTQWVSRASANSRPQQNVEAAKTPSRLHGSLRGFNQSYHQQQSPMNYD